MELSTAIKERRSIRAFRSDDIADETIRELLDEARWAPSWANAQGWDVFVVKGAALDGVKRMLAEKHDQHAEPATDVRMPERGEWPRQIKERMSFRRHPQAPPPQPAAKAAACNPEPAPRPEPWDIYGAPVLLLFGVHERLAVEYACFDLGLFVENVCLAAENRGLGTCIMAMVVQWADALHDMIPAAEDQRFVVGVALGHPDEASPFNQVERERCPLGEVVQFVR
jgi:nitroreductase